MQEAHWVDGLDGLQDLLPETQGGAHGEGSSGLTPPQVGQVTTLRQKTQGRSHTDKLTQAVGGSKVAVVTLSPSEDMSQI